MKKNEKVFITVFIAAMFTFLICGIHAAAQTAATGEESIDTSTMPTGLPPLFQAATTTQAIEKKHGMSSGQAVILGLTEGITEFLPVSSTGHLYMASSLMGLYKDENGKPSKDAKEAADAYEICIQLGAILAVLVLYWKRIKSMIAGLLGKDSKGKKLAGNILVAFLPAAVTGLLLEKHIKQVLFGIVPITLAWFFGGIVILLISKQISGTKRKTYPIDALLWKQALLIGIFQCLAMWPGVSRSLATIVGAVLLGLSVPAAVEFSFLLGLVTLGAATSKEILTHGHAIIATFGFINPLLGMIVAFVSAAVAVKWMVSYLNSRGLNIFGYYRIALAIVAAILIYSGII